jgi:hypothetical protein
MRPPQPPQQGYGQQQGAMRPPQPPQQGYPQQPPQQGDLGQNRPPLQSRPRPDTQSYAGQNPNLRGRDNRRQDDYDRIYDDGDMGGLGDFIDGI